MTTEDNGNVMELLKPTSSSNEDLSEYTDADESISAPTEFLAEFLSAVMLKDYVTALKYCKLILQYEPNNAAAKEFYPLIIEKLQQNSTDHPAPVSFQNKPGMANAFANQGNQFPFGTSSDSESPTEPVTQQTIAMLRARVVPNKM
nr:glutamate-rich protein 2 [Leptinotarsa decemlineata]